MVSDVLDSKSAAPIMGEGRGMRNSKEAHPEHQSFWLDSEMAVVAASVTALTQSTWLHVPCGFHNTHAMEEGKGVVN